MTTELMAIINAGWSVVRYTTAIYWSNLCQLLPYSAVMAVILFAVYNIFNRGGSFLDIALVPLIFFLWPVCGAIIWIPSAMRRANIIGVPCSPRAFGDKQTIVLSGDFDADAVVEHVRRYEDAVSFKVLASSVDNDSLKITATIGRDYRAKVAIRGRAIDSLSNECTITCVRIKKGLPLTPDACRTSLVAWELAEVVEHAS